MAPFNRTGFNHIKARLALPPLCVCVHLLLVSVSSPPSRRVPPQRRAAGRHGGPSSEAREDGAGLFVLRQPPFFPLSRLPLPQATVRELPGWGMSINAAAPPPRSPACGAGANCGEPREVMLVPHGGTELRIGEFPLV